MPDILPRTSAPSRLAAAPPSSAAAWRPLARDAPPALVGFGSVFGLAASNGGFFPTSWGWAALPLLLAAGAALVVRDPHAVTRPEAAFLALLAALTAWTASSALWSPSPAGLSR